MKITQAAIVVRNEGKLHLTASLSILKSIADTFDLQARKEVYVTRMTRLELMTVEFVTLNVKDQYLSRSDMWRLRMSLIDTALYVGKRVNFCGNAVRVITRELVDSEGDYRLSGRVGETTKVLFRSESAIIFLLIQMSREMWQFDEDGDLYMEKAIYGCLPDLFRQWTTANTSHTLCIVLFNRMWLKNTHGTIDEMRESTDNRRSFEDCVRVVVEWEHRNDWTSILPLLRQECFNYLHNLPDSCKEGINSSASEGNVLEMLNLCMNVADRHILNSDRDCTVISMILVTPTSAFFEVDPDWLRLTKKRMVDRGIGCDFFCLSKPPLHIVPLLRLKERRENESTRKSTMDQRTHNAENPHNHVDNNDPHKYLYNHKKTTSSTPTFVVPHWCECSFYSSNNIYDFSKRSLQIDAIASPQQSHHSDASPSLASFASIEHDSIPCPSPAFSFLPSSTLDASSTMSDFQPRCRLPSIQMGLVDVFSSSSLLRPIRQHPDLQSSSSSLQSTSNHQGTFNSQKVISDISSTSTVLSSGSLVDEMDAYDSQIFATLTPQFRTSSDRSTVKDISSIKMSGSKRSFIDTGTEIDSTTTITKPTTLTIESSAARIPTSFAPSIPYRLEKGTELRQDYTDHVAVVARNFDEATSTTAITAFRGHRRSPSRTLTAASSSESTAAKVSVSSRVDTNSLRNGGERRSLARSSSSSSTSSPPSARHSVVALRRDRDATRLSSLETGRHRRLNRPSALIHQNQQQQPQQRIGITNALFNSQEPLSDGAIPIPRINRPALETNMDLREGPPFQYYDSTSPSEVTTTNPVMTQSDGSNQNASSGNHLLPAVPLISSLHHSRDSPPMLMRSQFGRFLNQEREEGNVSKTTVHQSASSLQQDNGVDNSVAHAMTISKSDVKPETIPNMTTTINPCDPKNMISKATGYRRRWYHLLYRYFGQYDSTAWTNWVSIVTPAALPLTSDYFPRRTDLETSYKEYTYLVSPKEEDENDVTPCLYTNSIDLLREMVAQRIAQGYQMVLSSTDAGIDETTMSFAKTSLMDNPLISSSRSGTVTSAATVYHLSMGHQYQKLGLDSAGQNIEVRRYSRLFKPPVNPILYAYRMSSRYTKSFESRLITMAHTNPVDYPWNHADQLISGFSTELTESLQYSKSAFVLIPVDPLPKHLRSLNPTGEELNEQELRVAGFLKFVELFQRGVYHPRHHIDITTLDRATYLANELATLLGSRLQSIATTKTPTTSTIPTVDGRIGGETIITNTVSSGSRSSNETRPLSSMKDTMVNASFPPKLSKNTRISSIVTLMIDPKYGLNVRDRRWNFRLHRSVFIGSECVDWFLKMFVDIQTREDAVQFGNMLFERGIIEHVRSAHRFLDGHYFYRIKSSAITTSNDPSLSTMSLSASTVGPPAVLEAISATSNSSMTASSSIILARRWLQNARQDPAWKSALAIPADTIESTGSSLRNEDNDHRLRFELSHRAHLDVDPNKRSERVEWAHLHYDAIYNPDQAYHFQIHWLVATGRLIEELIQSWARRAAQCGLLLVEVSVDQLSVDDSMDILLMPVHIPLVLAPPSFDDVFREIFESFPIGETPYSSTDMNTHDPKVQEYGSFEDLGFSRVFFEEALLKEHHFVLDVLADKRLNIPPDLAILIHSYPRPVAQFTQYIHRTGCALIQLFEVDSLSSSPPEEASAAVPTKTNRHPDIDSSVSSLPSSVASPSAGFIWLRNRFTCPRPLNAQLADRVLADFTAFCGDATQLETFYRRKKLDMINEVQLMCRHGSLQWDRFSSFYASRMSDT